MIRKKGVYERYIKRPQDFFLSAVALLLLSPVLLIIAILIRLKLGGPVIFVQQRPGLNEKTFKMYKFRTMTNEYDANGELLSDSIRLTSFGRFLRSTSLDELPELWNIVRGDMAIVGPRPLLVQYLSLYDEEQKRRHDVRPGLTGYAQVNGRNALCWEDKFKLDVEYVDKISIVVDWKIFFLTIKKVVIREGIHSENSITVEPYRGSSKERVKL
ncbi:sugar transferase [Paenibacillus odorifer]|uniref:sugar transferase n=1 Tax=Paenibacillus TaxID=44249 RepID=UPI00096DA473|nr:sugar transferase [Paenibacillus odorifer]OMC67812.1 sugar transferase [Paenibacillus odorifer]